MKVLTDYQSDIFYVAKCHYNGEFEKCANSAISTIKNSRSSFVHSIRALRFKYYIFEKDNYEQDILFFHTSLLSEMYSLGFFDTEHIRSEIFTSFFYPYEDPKEPSYMIDFNITVALNSISKLFRIINSTKLKNDKEVYFEIKEKDETLASKYRDFINEKNTKKHKPAH